MAKHLVIVESPAKAKTINKILGPDYIVRACMGHVRDLPEKNLGVDIENGFKPQYVSIKSKQKVLKELRDEAKKVETVYLAPDPDREGEAIAWHLLAALKKEVAEENFYRVTYNEITAPALKAAFASPGRLDRNRFDAQQARRVLDRLVGYKVSPLLWSNVRGGSSAGRVQSVALRLVCEREREIENFVPEEFWLLGANVRKQEDPKDPFAIRLARINDEKAEIKDGDHAKKILAELETSRLLVSSIAEKEVRRRAQPPYITSTLQQAGSRFHGFTPSRTMRIAQGLYEGADFGEGAVGLITYMRTDSVAIAAQAQQQCRAFVGETYGPEYVPEKPNFYKSRGSAQEAHEAIRPTDVHRTPDSLAGVLKPEELKLYRTIWERFVASQMSPARIAQKTVEIESSSDDANAAKYLFRVTASEVVFAGYMKVTGREDQKKKKPAGSAEEGAADSKVDEVVDQLPPLREGEPLDLLEWLSEQKFTQPPGRYSEASLVRAMEENGVGRPSTYAQTISTLQDRAYVDKEKRSLKPSELGLRVNDFLVSHLDGLFNVKFTAEMEESLDEIEQGSVQWTEMLTKFYASFEDWILKAKGPDAEPELVRSLIAVTEPVTAWSPPVKKGRRTYSDEKFVVSLGEQLDKGEKPISARQLNALKQIVSRYHGQIPDIDAKAEALGLVEALVEARKPVEPPREATQTKLDLLKTVTFNEARKIGKRTYDDKAFSESLRQQVEGGKRLSENQLRYLDRLVVKYSDQIENFEQISPSLDLSKPEEGAGEADVAPIMALFDLVTTWKPPVQRGKRLWDDKEFFTSLSTQFKARKSLSPRQLASLKKMVVRYADQIPDYAAHAEKLGLGMPKPKKEKKGAEEESE